MKKVFKYSDFGAVGDGVADDFLAIKRTHEAANAESGTVLADGKCYYIGASSFGDTAIIKTDTDFADATFIFDDTILPPYHEGKTKNIFAARPSDSCQAVSLEPATLQSLKLNKGMTGYIGFKLGYPALLRITNTAHKVYIRYGGNANAGQNMTEIVLIDENGIIDESTPIIWDYDNITSITAFPVNEEPITIKGGHFITWANQICTEFPDDSWKHGNQYYYYCRGIACTRSNVTVKDLTHSIEKEGEQGYPYGGWLAFVNCNNITVENCIFTTHKTYVQNGPNKNWMGTYDFSGSGVNNITWKNCREFSDIADNTHWGTMATNYCKNLTYDGCTLARFDAHEGMCNATIKNSTIGRFINAIGSGTLLIENVTKLAPEYFIWLRDDYGSTWDGDVIIKNCRFEGRNMHGLMVADTDKFEDEICIIKGAYFNHNFGYTCSLPKSIVIDGFEAPNAKRVNLFDIKGLTPASFEATEDNQNVIVKPDKISVLGLTGEFEFRKFKQDGLEDLV